jgi:hypothetical protein
MSALNYNMPVRGSAPRIDNCQNMATRFAGLSAVPFRHTLPTKCVGWYLHLQNLFDIFFVPIDIQCSYARDTRTDLHVSKSKSKVILVPGREGP